MYGCESWTIKKAEQWRIDAFELWCWRRLLRVPWAARRSNQTILKENSPEYSLEGLIMELKRQYFGHQKWRTDSLEKTLMLGKIEGGGEGDGRGWDCWMASPTQWIWVWVNSGSWWWTGRPGVLQFMGSQRVGHNWVTELNGTESGLWSLGPAEFSPPDTAHVLCWYLQWQLYSGASPLPKSFQIAMSKTSLLLSLLGLDCFQLKIIHIARETFGRWQKNSVSL